MKTADVRPGSKVLSGAATCPLAVAALLRIAALLCDTDVSQLISCVLLSMVQIFMSSATGSPTFQIHAVFLS